jgi:hypothetical protein
MAGLKVLGFQLFFHHQRQARESGSKIPGSGTPKTWKASQGFISC